MKKTASLLLALIMAAPPIEVVSAPELGTIKGAVTVSSRPISGVSLAFVDLASGNIYRATSEETGTFQARVPAGRYVLTTENGAGLAVGRAPSMIAVIAGQIATADVDLAPIPGATMASASGASMAQAPGQAPPLPEPPGPPGPPPTSSTTPSAAWSRASSRWSMPTSIPRAASRARACTSRPRARTTGTTSR